jgi:hypothetical protein
MQVFDDGDGSLPTIVPIIFVVLGVIRQVDRLSLALARDLQQGSDVAVVHRAGERERSIDEQADRSTEQFLGTNGGAELPSLLGGM